MSKLIIPEIKKREITSFEIKDKDVISFLDELKNYFEYEDIDDVLQFLEQSYLGLKEIKERCSKDCKKELLYYYKDAYIRCNFVSRLLTIAKLIPFNELMKLKPFDVSILLITTENEILLVYDNIQNETIDYNQYL